MPLVSLICLFLSLHIQIYMINRSLLLLICLLLAQCLHAQKWSHAYPPNTYRSADNPYYWKNRPPYPGYWQQDTYYNIKVSLDDSTDILDGSETLTYWNNSPDDLPFVFFHLYQNSFQPGSYLDDLQKENGVKPRYGQYESKGLGTTIDEIMVDGKPLKHEIDYSIMKVWLDKPLKSGESITFSIKFKTYYDNGSTRRRMKKFMSGAGSHYDSAMHKTIIDSGFKHYDGVLFYPRIAVYDRKFGWDTNQHLNREFYGDFGCYDVELTLPNIYVLEATGVLQNQQEVMPDSLRKRLDIFNFRGKKWESEPSVPIKRNGTKTWVFHSENTHDFAWTADPTYRMHEVDWKGVKCIALVQEAHAGRWQNAADHLSKIIQTYSRDIGMYAYPKIVVADAQDGMEYPMLTLDGGMEPGYRYLFSHEVGHNWFYGMVGNNETYRAALDEGFTQFLTSWAMDHIDGPYEYTYGYKSKYVSKHHVAPTNIYQRNYYPYLSAAIRGDETTINTHSDYFNGALNHGGGYGQVYFKTGTMLYDLQYVLGDSLFLKTMQHYFDQWKMCHPYFEDFRNSVIQYTHADLTWFFDAWMETNKTIDYGVKCVKKDKSLNAGNDDYTITFKRYGRLQMPLDFRVYAKDGKTYDYLIPCNWFTKPTESTVLPKWQGWDKLNPTYQARVTIPSGIENVRIDTSLRLADIDLRNNTYKCPIKLKGDYHIFSYPDWTHYEMHIRPDIWWNAYDGAKVGVHLDGNYLNYKGIFNLDVWGNTGLGQYNLPYGTALNGHDIMSYRFNYKTPLTGVSKNTFFNLSVKYLDGLHAYTIGGEKEFDKDENTKVTFYTKAMYRHDSTDLTYLLYPTLWQANKWNNTLNLGIQHSYSYTHGTGNLNLALKTSSIGSAYDYSTLTFTSINKNTIGKLDFNTRLFAQYGTGTNWTYESSLYLAGANPEELMDNKYTRSVGFVPNTWVGYGNDVNHFQAGGGLNLRGYAGYLVAQADKEITRSVYAGTTGASFNAELGFDRLFSFIRPQYIRDYIKINTYLFGDAGIINYNSPSESLAFADLRADAGVGVALTIHKWGVLQEINPLTIRFDMPLFLSRIPNIETNNFQFRWIVGVNRAF